MRSARRRGRPADPAIEPTRLTWRDLGSESLAGLLQRPARTVLTALGTVLGVGAFTAILGLTTTTQGQINTDFTVLASTQVTVNDVGDTEITSNNTTMYDFPAGADQAVDRLDGVVGAGVYWQVFHDEPTVSTSSNATADNSQQFQVYAASPGMLTAAEPTVSSGVLYNSFHDNRKMQVAVLGSAVAGQLGITNLADQPAVFIDGTPYTVVGILSGVQRDPQLLLSVMIPDQTALAQYGDPSTNNPASMLIETRVGAAQLIAHQAPLDLRPDNPSLLQAVPPPDPHALQDNVAGNLNTLFLLLAGITLVIGAVGIANTTLVSVLERTGEIGLRRALGGKPRHIAGQFLAESTVLGTLGGLIGTAIGIGLTLAIALSHDWTAILNPWITYPAPLVGTLTGLAAGLYPALRAARIEPAEALRR